MKATKKPVQIDYLYYDGVKRTVSNWVDSLGDKFSDHFENEPMGTLYVKTLEGTSYPLIAERDVIIRGIKGEYYPCKKDIFEATYETPPPTSQTAEELADNYLLRDEQIESEVNHIFESGANKIRIVELIKRYIKRAQSSTPPTSEDIRQMAVEYAEGESVQYLAANPFPKHYPSDSAERLMDIFKKQCVKNFIAGAGATGKG